jgi:hypothetical protein
MACDTSYIYGDDYNQAMLQADICTYENLKARLDSVAQLYNSNINSGIAAMNRAAEYRVKAKALGIIGMTWASLGLYNRSISEVNTAEDRFDTARWYIEDKDVVYTKYTPVADYVYEPVYDSNGNYMYSRAVTIGYFIVLYGNVSLSYEDAIAEINTIANRVSNFESYSFGITIGLGGDSMNIIVDASTISTLVNFTIDAAYDAGVYASCPGSATLKNL